jgi:hypothetical protein
VSVLGTVNRSWFSAGVEIWSHHAGPPRFNAGRPIFLSAASHARIA